MDRRKVGWFCVCYGLSWLKSGSRCLHGNHFLFPRIQAPNSNSIADWWEAATKTVTKDKKFALNAASIYSMWNLSKEMNQRIFQNERSTSLALVNEDVEQRQRAFGRCNGSLSPLNVLVCANLDCAHPSGELCGPWGQKIIHYFSPLIQGRATANFLSKNIRTWNN